MLGREVVGIRFHDSLRYLSMLGLLLLIHDSILLTLDLVFDILLLVSQVMLTHDLTVEEDLFLLEARLQESLPHLLDDIVNGILIHIQTSEFNPFSGEAWAHLYTVLEI